MALLIDDRTHLEGELYAFVNEEGSLIISSSYGSDALERHETYKEITSITSEGVKALYALLERDAQLRIGADDAGHSEAFCACVTHHNFQEVAINHCFECGKPLHS